MARAKAKKKRALAKAKLSDFRVRHYLYHEPKRKWRRPRCPCGEARVVEIVDGIAEQLGIQVPPSPHYYGR